MIVNCTGPWLMCGDFNLTRSQNERRGRLWSSKLMRMFNNLINSLELIDLPVNNQFFTWSNNQSTPSLAKLDRFLISTEWDSLLPNSNVTALPRITSDHSPLLLKTRPKQHFRAFRLEKVWLTREDFNLLVPIWWRELDTTTGSILSFASRLRHCRKRIKEWRASNFYSIRNAKRKTIDEIHKLNLLEEVSNLTANQLLTRSTLKEDLKTIIADEELLWQARAKQHWLKEGDGNTSFFHAMANGRARTNHIAAVEEDGRRLEREQDKSDYFYRMFKERFAPGDTQQGSRGDWSEIYSGEDFLCSEHLTAPFTMEEIKKAVFQLNSDKAPGPDGFSMRFYQKFWDVISTDILRIFEDLHAGSLNTGPIDYSYICLIPKTEGAKTANDFRPICLLNCIQKIISKVLATRLEAVMKNIISPSQTAFLKGRLILDSFVTASELVSWSSKVKSESVGIKADFEKAFDKVDWNFLRSSLVWLGANNQWCDWINQCIANGKIAILVNGVPSKWIKTKRGLRQGDPLSPLLFLIVAEGLARIMERAIKHKLLSGVGPTTDAKIAIIQYADDTIFFCEAKKSQIRNLKFIWRIFEWASGLKINRCKSELFYMGKSRTKGKRLADLMECKLGSLPIRYLGLPLSRGQISKDDWRGIISRIEKRIEGWQAKLLSQGGRLTLVNSVLTNLPLYFFSVFKAPKWVLRRIDSLRKAFFWRGTCATSRGLCLVDWKTVCRAKRDGGLGILNLDHLNTALLVKWWWRLFTSKSTAWGHLIQRLYYTRRRPLWEGKSFKPFSQWWRSVLGTKALFRCCTSRSVGNGRWTSFWSDIWLGNTSLRCLFPHIFGAVHSKACRVSDCFGRRGWNRLKTLAGYAPTNGGDGAAFQSLADRLSETRLTNLNDIFKWRWTNSEIFTVKSLYRFLQDTGVHQRGYLRIWSIKAPLKVKIFIWLLLRRRVLTMDRILKWGWSVNTNCLLCPGPVETVDHLFATCDALRLLVSYLLPSIGPARGCSSVKELWDMCIDVRATSEQRDLNALAAIWWTIWLERNNRRFRTASRNMVHLCSEARSLASSWASHCP